MTEVLTRSAVDVFSPVDGSANARGADMGEVQTWGTEIENLLGTDFDGGLFTWDTGTTDANPGSGKIRANNASLASATVLYISKTSRAGSPLAAFLAALDDASNIVKGTLILTKRPTGTQATFNVGVVTDASGYIKLAISNPSGETSFPANSIMSFQFSRAGDSAIGPAFAMTNSTTMADPTAGFVRFNNASLASATAIAISSFSAESGNPSRSGWLNTFDDSTTTAHRGLLTFTKLLAPEVSYTFDITAGLTDNTTWKQLTVVYVSGSGTFSPSDILVVSFDRTGNAGAGSGDLQAANNLSDVASSATSRVNLGIIGIPCEVLSADRTYYVRTDGSNSNTGLANTSGGAFLTIDYAVKWVRRLLNFGGYTVTIQVGAGTYVAGFALTDGNGFTNGVCQVIGDFTTPSNVLIQPSSATAACFQATRPVCVSIGGFKLAGGSNVYNGIYASAEGVINVIGKMEYGAISGSLGAGFPSGSHVMANAKGTVLIVADAIISGSAGAHFAGVHGGLVEVGSAITETLSGAPAFANAFMYAVNAGKCVVGSVTYSGSATGSRFNTQYGGSIDSGFNGSTYYPGNASGTIGDSTGNRGNYF